MQKLQGWTQAGNGTVTMNSDGDTSTTKFQHSYPACTVTVYEAGTATLATIYSDDGVTALANPFTAAPTPDGDLAAGTPSGLWYFYAANGEYDVRFSGTGIDTAFTLGALKAYDENETYFNVKDQAYGAIGDGVTDDTTAIQNTITAAMAATGRGVVFLPEGKYLVSSTITVPNDNITIMGCGPNNSYFYRTTDYGSTLNLQIANDYVNLVTLRDFGIRNEASSMVATGAELELHALVNSAIQNVRIRGDGVRVGVEAYGLLQTVFDNLIIDISGTYNVNRYGMKFLGRGYGSPGNNGSVKIINSEIDTPWVGSGNASVRACIYIEAMDGFLLNNTRLGGATIANVILSASDATYNMSHFLASNCFFDLTPGRALLTTGSSALSFENIIVTGSHFGGHSTSGTAIDLQGNATDVQFNGNRYPYWADDVILIQDSVSNIQVHGGIFWNYNQDDALGQGAIRTSATWTGAGLKIIGTDMNQTATKGRGIHLQAGTNIIIADNRIWNNATGITVDLGVTDYHIVNNDLQGNTTGLTDNGGAVDKVIRGNLGFSDYDVQKIGYDGPSVGGTVTQITTKATAVTCNYITGQITMVNTALAANTVVRFNLNNSHLEAYDTLLVQRQSGGTGSSYKVWTDYVSAGVAGICVENITGGSLSEAVVIQFSVIKGDIN